MRGNIIKEKNSCTACGCQRVTIRHKAGGDIQAAFSLDNPALSAKYEARNSQGVKASFSLVCKTSQGEWEYLLVDEGRIVLADGNAVLVKRKGG